MEHINRNAISCLGSNTTNESIQRAGKCIKVLMEITNQPDNVNGVLLESYTITLKVMRSRCEKDDCTTAIAKGYQQYKE